MERQAAVVRGSIDDADRILQAHVTFDPSFVPFAQACLDREIPLMVLSSGLAPLIERALQRNRAPKLPLVAADILIEADGVWTLRYPGDSPNGTDKAVFVRRAREDGFETVFIGDGPSDFAAARIADRRFAKRANSLERYLANEGLAFTPFTSFADVQRALF
jgi:2-hydroxy-3-keto-5-methylthiopentenyl-1-phosphate phosphatase